jgi:hypothetical protein
MISCLQTTLGPTIFSIRHTSKQQLNFFLDIGVWCTWRQLIFPNGVCKKRPQLFYDISNFQTLLIRRMVQVNDHPNFQVHPGMQSTGRCFCHKTSTIWMIVYYPYGTIWHSINSYWRMTLMHCIYLRNPWDIMQHKNMKEKVNKSWQ